MHKLLCFILSVNRKRRSLAVRLVLCVLRIIHGIEEDELNRYSDILDEFNSVFDTVSQQSYNEAEDDCINCEFVLGFLISAIEDLEFAYETRS